MIHPLTDLDSSGRPSATLIGDFHEWTIFYVQAFGPNVVRLARTKAELERKSADGSNQGIQVSAPDGAVKFAWKGQLWAIASGPNTAADFQVF